MPHPTGFPPILAIVAVLACAGIFIVYYQALFPRPARWRLVLTAFALGGACTGGYLWTLAPSGERFLGITDAWSALRLITLAAGLPEEAVKLLATMGALIVFRRDLRPAEAFQAALVAALGFAALENALYARMLPEAAVLVAAGRGVSASFVHSMFAMIQGYFLAAFIRSNWRRWDLPVFGYLAAVVAHSAFDWGLIRPLLDYLQTKTIRPESVAGAVPIAIPCILGVILLSLWLFRRALRKSGAEDPITAEPAHLVRRARWRRVGTGLLVIGILGLLGTVAVIVTEAVQGQLSVRGPGQVSPDEFRSSVILTLILAVSPMLILFGWITRQKQ